MNTVDLPKPHARQQDILGSVARFKIVRAGRRFGKDRLALHGCVVGHGNGRWRGMAQGVDIAWVGPDFPQLRAIWREEVEKRFRGVTGVDLLRQEHRVVLRGAGALEFRTAENIDSLRGRKLGGVVVNEAAYLNLEYALREVLMPALIDLGGWVLIISTPNAGPDGFEDEGGKRTPSYFNILCEKYAAGELPADWQHWHYTTRDNPTIPAHEVEALYAQYQPESPQLAQELDAKLIVAGSGVAFPEWADDVHVARYSPELDGRMRWSGGGDWGYESNGCLYLIATGPERSLVRHEFYFRRITPYDAGFRFGEQVKRFPRPEYLVVDVPTVSDGGPTITEQLQRGLMDSVGKDAPPFITPPKGAGSRITKKALFHEALKYTRHTDGTVSPWAMPKLQMHPDCVNLIRTIPRLPLDPKNPTDVDTKAEDHAYDGITSWLMARTPHVEREKPKNLDPDAHPGWDAQGKRLDTRTPLVADDGPRWSRHAGVR